MIIEFKDVTRAGNNVRAIMFFDHILVAELHCTPDEFTRFVDRLNAGSEITRDEEVIVSQA